MMMKRRSSSPLLWGALVASLLALSLGARDVPQSGRRALLQGGTPVDCKTSAWAWTKCSAPCGGGTQSGTRTITQQPANGGKACPTNLTSTRTCNTQLCTTTTSPAPAQSPSPSPSGVVTPQSEINLAISDGKQLPTIAFYGHAWLTGNFSLDTFLPGGKVSDYFGFQYLRDIDAAQQGHSGIFLTKIAGNMLSILTDAQKDTLKALASELLADVTRFAQLRFPLMAAFRQTLNGSVPAGSAGLNLANIKTYSADLYELDGQVAFKRAQVLSSILSALTPDQLTKMSTLKFGDSSTWPDQTAVVEAVKKSAGNNEVFTAVMAYAADMFSWSGGSVGADTYFAPERHAMYFGGFGMKSLTAWGNPTYQIPGDLTDGSGKGFLAALNTTQRAWVTSLLNAQRTNLTEIVTTRKAIATELRKLLTSGGSADLATVTSLSRRYGELDGEISYLYAAAFTKVGQSLTATQRATLVSLRPAIAPTTPTGPFLYSTPVSDLVVGSTDYLFGL